MNRIAVIALVVVGYIPAVHGQWRMYGTLPAQQPDGVSYGTLFSTKSDGSDFTVEHSFSKISFFTELVLAPNGKMYGMSKAGGKYGLGTIFEFNPITQVLTVMFEFTPSTGGAPWGSMMVASNGKLYGCTPTTLFEYDYNSNTVTKKFDFVTSTGTYPFLGKLVEASNGKLYGTARFGGTSPGYGTIFEFDYSTGIFATKHRFGGGSNGLEPWTGLTLASNGNLYGVTPSGGANGQGILYEYNIATSTFTKKYDFGSVDGGRPEGGLTAAGNGKLYAVTSQGGASNFGTLIEFDPVLGAVSKKKDFNTATGTVSSSTLVFVNNKLYGTTFSGGVHGNGTIFEYDPLGNTLTVKVSITNPNKPYRYTTMALANSGKLYGALNSNNGIYEFDINANTYNQVVDFNIASLGLVPSSTLAQTRSGKIYGMTSAGGINSGGVIFEFDPFLKTFTKKFEFTASTGTAPKGGLLLASNGKFYGTTSAGGSAGRGTLFEFDYLTGIFTKKANFAVGSGVPKTELIQASNGKLYGYTTEGSGKLFEYDIVTGSLVFRVTFSGGNGRNPLGSLMEASNGNLYGTTSSGGALNNGVLFEYNPTTFSYVKRYEFSATNQGYSPGGAPVQATNGLLYGVTRLGGSSGYGVVYEFNLATNTYTMKADFQAINASNAQCTLTQQPNGKLYGTTTDYGLSVQNDGVLFQYDPVANVLSGLINFNSTTGNDPVNSRLMTLKESQTVSLDPIAAVTYGQAPFLLLPVVSSGLPVTLFSSNTQVATISGGTITIVGGGASNITAEQKGNNFYHPAYAVQPLVVNKRALTVNAVPASKIYGEPNPSYYVTFSGFVNGDGPGQLLTQPSASTLNVGNCTAVGSYQIDPCCGVDESYSFVYVPSYLSINKRQLTVTANNSSKLYGSLNPSFTTTTSGLVCGDTIASIFNGITISLASPCTRFSNAGTSCPINVSFTPAPNPVNYNVVPQAGTLTINQTSQTITFNSVPSICDGSPFDLSPYATSTSPFGLNGLPISFSSSNPSIASISGTNLTFHATGSVTVTASQAGNANVAMATHVPILVAGSANPQGYVYQSGSCEYAVLQAGGGYSYWWHDYPHYAESPSRSVSSSGNYKVNYYTPEGCFVTAQIDAIVCGGGTQQRKLIAQADPYPPDQLDLDADFEMGVYPNPAMDHVRVVLTELAKEDCYVVFYDILGRFTMRDVIVKGRKSKTIQIGGIDPGVYIVIIMDNGELKQKKLVVKRL